MTILQKIERNLKNYPHVKYQATEASVVVEPLSASGFEVGLVVLGGTYSVSFNGWHEEFKSMDDAMKCFAFGLSSAARLKVCARGKVEYRWTLQHKVDGNWQDESSTGLLLFPFWLKKHAYYLQNDITAK